MTKIARASIEDIDELMNFMDKFWKKGHILSINRQLFCYEFCNDKYLNMTIARDADNKIVGIFGYMYYNSLKTPDIAGSLWKVIPQCKEPMLGLKMRSFTIRNILHRFFAAPGAGLQTKAIYQIIGMRWKRMDQWFLLNDHLTNYRIADIPKSYRYKKILKKPEKWSIEKIQENMLDQFDFAKWTYIVPFKDESYIKKRFFNHPIYRYEVYGVRKKTDSLFSSIFVFRIAEAEGRKVIRVVDFYGLEETWPAIGTFLYEKIVQEGMEYADFVSYGFDFEKLQAAGFEKLDIDQKNLIIPNYFEPFVKRNIPVYCVHDPLKEGWQFRQCKADGDQDRPNVW